MRESGFSFPLSPFSKVFMLREILLPIHVIAGMLVFITATIAILSKSFNVPHRVHVVSGIAYCIGMLIMVATGMPLAWLRTDGFTFSIGIFSLYFVLMGWRYALNRKGDPSRVDGAILGVGVVGMVALYAQGVVWALQGGMQMILPFVFGTIALLSVREDYLRLRQGSVKGKARISAHLGRMLPATIAIVTAFTVQNVTGELGIVAWLAPTVVITPLIGWWEKQLQKGRKPTGMTA
jgi:hypothetical protein